MTERDYDNMFNEGATDGFNPYRTLPANDGEPMWSKVESRISKLQRLLNGMSDIDPRRAGYIAEQAELKIAYGSMTKTY